MTIHKLMTAAWIGAFLLATATAQEVTDIQKEVATRCVRLSEVSANTLMASPEMRLPLSYITDAKEEEIRAVIANRLFTMCLHGVNEWELARAERIEAGLMEAD